MALPSSSIALLSRLRRNSRLLLSDLSCARSTDYPSLWNFYIDCLGHNEPAIRSFCLKCLRMLSTSIASTLLELPKQIRLVKLLCDILSGDEVPLHRALAAVVLGHCVPFMVLTRFPQKILRYAFSLLLSQFCRVFPSNYSTLETDVKERFLKSSDTNRKTLEYNLSFIRALGCFFITEPAQDTEFVNYIDSLFSNLLSVTIHELYTAEILRALCVGLPITNRNLKRIERFYLHQLHEMTSIISKNHSEGGPVKQSVLSSTAAYLREQMTMFLSKWHVEYGNQNTMGLGFPKETYAKVEVSLAKAKTTTPVMSLTERLKEYRAFAFTESALSDQVKKDDTVIDIVADLAIRDHVDDVKSTIQSKPILSFSTAHISTLTFHRLPYKKEVHIHNKSMVNDVPFRVEVFPSQFFKVYPASGIVPKSKSYTIFVTFLPQPRMLLPSSEVDGFISLRSESGSLINRMPLRAINPPSVWCSATSLDFGCCPVGEIRSLYVYIKNLSSVDCNCCVTVSHKSASSHSSFRVTPSQAILQPFERRVLTVQFMPLLEEIIEEEITVISDTGEFHSINMSGVGKSMLAAGDTKLDFGLTDLHHYLTPGSRRGSSLLSLNASSIRRIILYNQSPNHSLRVFTSTTTAELIVNNNHPIILHPNEERSVPVQFSSAMLGLRNEKIFFNSPASATAAVDVSSFTGRQILVPIWKNLWTTQQESNLGPTGIGSATGELLRIPIINTSQQQVQMAILLPQDSPFTLQILEPRVSNTEVVLLESQPYVLSPESSSSMPQEAVTAKEGILLTMGPVVTATLEISLKPRKPGTFRSTITFEAIKPRRYLISHHFLNAVCISSEYFIHKSIEDLKGFLNNPGDGDVLINEIDIGDGANYSLKPSTVLEIEPITLTMFATNDRETKELICEGILTISNMTSQPQQFNILLSSPFAISAPFSGTIPGLSALDIPIFVDLDSTQIDEEQKEYLLTGTIVILDQQNNGSSVYLNAVMSSAVGLECRSDLGKIKFPACRVLQKSSRKFAVRNRLPVEMVWEGKMIETEVKGITAAVAEISSGQGPNASDDGVEENTADIRCPFQLVSNRLILKPFSFVYFEISFQATSSGVVSATLSHEYYKSPSSSISTFHPTRSKSMPKSVDLAANSPRLREPTVKFPLPNVTFECTAGKFELSVQPDFLFWGQHDINQNSGRLVSKDLIVQNNQSLETQIHCVPASWSSPTPPSYCPFSISVPSSSPTPLPNITLNVPPSQKIALPIPFTPTQYGDNSGFVSILFENQQMMIPILGIGGLSRLVSNLGLPRQVREEDSTVATEKKGEVARQVQQENEKPLNQISVFNSTSDTSAHIIQFGSVPLNSYKVKQFQIENAGTFGLWITHVEVIGNRREIENNAKVLDRPNKKVNETMQQLYWRTVGFGNPLIFARTPNNSAARSLTVQHSKMRAESISPEKDPKKMVIPSGRGLEHKEDPWSNVLPNEWVWITESRERRSKIKSKVAPGQKLDMELCFVGKEKGNASYNLRIHCERVTGQKEYFEFLIEGTVHPCLKVANRKIEFRAKEVNCEHIIQTKLSNPSSVTIPWRVSLQQLTYTNCQTKLPMGLSNNHCSPITIYPSSGSLLPHSNVVLEIKFKPAIPSQTVNATFVIISDDFVEIPIYIQGTGGLALLTSETSEMDFETLRIGCSKISSVRVKNIGILPARFNVDCGDPQFSCEPEIGLIEPNSSLDFRVKYLPKSVAEVTSKLRISYQSSNDRITRTLYVNLSGCGGYPNLTVKTKELDFGVALMNHHNQQPIIVENSGAAEAHLVLSCYHSAISLKGIENGTTLIPPFSVKTIEVIYTPAVVEEMRSKLIIKSSDSRSQSFVVMVKGTVGVPKLTIQPELFFNSIDFGVCKIGGEYRKEFDVKNEGNIVVDFDILMTPASELAENGVVESSVRDRDLPIFQMSPARARVMVGKAVSVSILFRPKQMKEYKYKVDLLYQHHRISTAVNGSGGTVMLSLGMPIKLLDYGVCRMDKVYQKEIVLMNKGNIGTEFTVRPEPPNGDWSVYFDIEGDASKTWISKLAEKGFRIINPEGFAKPNGKTVIFVEFTPRSTAWTHTRVRIGHESELEEVDLRGCGATPKLSLYSPDNKLLSANPQNVSTIDIGIHPLGHEYSCYLKLVNEGLFPVDFYLQPVEVPEFDFIPQRGVVEPGSYLPLRMIFLPRTENNFRTTLRILWEHEPIQVLLKGSGGRGKIDMKYADKDDAADNCLDFGVIPITTVIEKRFFLSNSGDVDVYFSISVTGNEFSIAPIGEPLPVIASSDSAVLPATDRIASTFTNRFKSMVPLRSCLEVASRFTTNLSQSCQGSLTVETDTTQLTIPMKGQGGTFAIHHQGSLTFGEIAANHTYQRSLILQNSGSIPARVTFAWNIVGHSGTSSGAFVELSEDYSPLDPRTGWVRQQLIKEKNLSQNAVLTAKNYWWMIKRMIMKTHEEAAETSLSRKESVTSSILEPIPAPTSVLSRQTSANDRITSSASKLNNTKKKQYNMQAKRRQMFFNLIASTQMTNQIWPSAKPFVRINPASSLLPAFGETEINIELNLATEDTFLATIICNSDVPNTLPYEIPITASPKMVNIITNDIRKLHFGIQAIGHREVLSRTFTNVGQRDITFTIEHSNLNLGVYPNRGVLRVNAAINVQFAFEPTDDTIQNGPIYFQPDCSQPIKIEMFGGGGIPKMSISKYKRFDFGHCMIGKDTASVLPIGNEGDAILHITKYELVPSGSFFKGDNWPFARISILPGEVYNLPLIFHPTVENPVPGKLILGNSNESYEIALTGVGKEAVLIVTKMRIDFVDCLIGNSYNTKIGLKNVGDVNYPVTIRVQNDEEDLDVTPENGVIGPFCEITATIVYKPSRESKGTVNLIVSSPYSTNVIPIHIHSGHANLELSSSTIDFGVFEKHSSPSRTFTIRNAGSIKTIYAIRQSQKPHLFHIINGKGVIAPRCETLVTVTYILNKVTTLSEKLTVRTETTNKTYSIMAIGQCEEALVKAQEFQLLNFGICPVLETSSKTFPLTNYGKFPLKYNIKNVYPIKVNKAMGEVLGGHTENITISWNPSGGYELRTQMHVMTNVGTYQVVIRGKAAFPEIALRSNYIDFGVCAVGYSYTKTIEILNKGKVPLNWNVPTLKDYLSLSSVQGCIPPKESKVIELNFKPPSIGRFSTNVMIECRGINFREVAVVGVGGSLKVGFNQNLDIGQCPCDHFAYKEFTLYNKGDVPFHAIFGMDSIESIDCKFILPEPILVDPNKSARVTFAVMALNVGPVERTLTITILEKTYKIHIKGVGIKITLTRSMQELISNEKMDILKTIEPLFTSATHWAKDPVEIWLRQRQTRIDLDLSIIEHFANLGSAIKSSRKGGNQQGFDYDGEVNPPLGIINSEKPLAVQKQELIHLLDSYRQQIHEIPYTVLERVVQTFINMTQKSEGTIERPSNDPLIDHILYLPYPKFHQHDISFMLALEEPNVELNISPLIQRPPPLHNSKMDKSGKFRTNRISDWTKDSRNNRTMNRRERNARTVDAFKTVTKSL